MRSRHVLAFNIRYVQHGQLPAAGIAIFIFFLDGAFFAPSTGTFAATASGVIRFCGHFNHRLPYYPFDFAFFVKKRGRRFPQHPPVEIRPALPVAALVVNLLVTRTTKTHEVGLVIRSSLSKRHDMVDFLNRNIPSFL